MRKIHIANLENRDTIVQFSTSKTAAPPTTAGPTGKVRFRRYLATAPSGLHSALATGGDYFQSLIDGDPETDMEQVGRPIGETAQVYLASDGRVMHAPPEIIEILLAPDGTEKERRVPSDQEANVNDESPIRWTKRRMKRNDVVRRFAISRTVQLFHVDGLTFDYLKGMAKELDDADEMVLVGGGPKGADPLIFQTNGSPFRAFLEGRIDGDKFQLLLHLSNMELKRPA